MTRLPPPVRADYRWFHAITTRWMDNDAFGHVNNVVYYSWIDTAVNRFLLDHGLLDLAASPVVGIVAETGCRYISQITYPDEVTVGIRVAKLGRSSVRYAVGCLPRRRGCRFGGRAFRACLCGARQHAAGGDSGFHPARPGTDQHAGPSRGGTGQIRGTAMDTGLSGKAGDRLCGEQGAGTCLRDGSGARRGGGGDHRPHRSDAAAYRGGDSRRHRGGGDRGCRRHHHRSRPRRRPGRLPRARYPGEQCRRPAARRFPQLGAGGLDTRSGRQHARADFSDPVRCGRHVRAAVRPDRQYHVGQREVADCHAGHEQRRARRADGVRGRAGAAGGAP